MKRLGWWLQQDPRAVLALLGLAFALGAWAVLVGQIKPMAEQVAALRQVRASAPGAVGRQGVAGPAAAPSAPSAPAELAALQAFIASGERLAPALQHLHRLASAQGVELQHATYQLSPHAELALDRYRITLGVQHNYPTVRAFVTSALRELPTLALEQIQLRRKDIADHTLDAQITFVLYLAR